MALFEFITAFRVDFVWKRKNQKDEFSRKKNFKWLQNSNSGWTNFWHLSSVEEKRTEQVLKLILLFRRFSLFFSVFGKYFASLSEIISGQIISNIGFDL